MKYLAKPHTIVLLIGPSRCGKSTFAQKLAAGYPSDARILSSDALRHFHLTGEYKEKHDIYEANNVELMEMSSAAFRTMEHLLETWTTFPVNAEFIIVDSTGLSEEFRNKVFELGGRNNYNVDLVYFDYSHKDYMRGATTDLQKFIIAKHLKIFKQDVLPRMSKSRYSQAVRITARNENNWGDLVVERTEDPAKYEVQWSGPVAVIADVHENVEAAREMSSKLSANTLRIYVGDLFDKGRRTREMLQFLKEEKARGVPSIEVIGNHENYLSKRITGELEEHAAPEIEETYFTALEDLLADKDLANEFLEFRERMWPFVKVKSHGERNTIFVTHAPCHQKYIGKLNASGLGAMRNFRIEKGVDEKEALKHVFEEAVNNAPHHCFGHVAHSSSNVFFRNKAFLDRGAVHTGQLTAAVYEGFKREIVTAQGTPAMPEGAGTLPNLLHFEKKVLTRHDFDLDEEEERQLRMYVRNDIKYISGTMAPAPSSATQLESLEAGLDMFVKRGCTTVCIQPKFMGSRCQMYLFRGDLDRCFAVSRNGYRISERAVPDLRKVLAEHLAFQETFDSWKETRILDGELLPWSALGKDLIEREFVQYSKSIQSELVALANDPIFQNFQIGKDLNVEKRLELLEVFNKQLDLYGKDDEPRYQPFAVLSEDGVPYGRNTNHSFYSAGGDFDGFHSYIFDLTSETAYSRIQNVLESYVEEEGMEGIVIKPVDFEEGMIPYMKVRNENYLTLVYGYDYKLKYEELRRKKNVSGKVGMSIREHKLATSMLSAPKERLEGMYCEMMFNIRQEKELDPRL